MEIGSDDARAKIAQDIENEMGSVSGLSHIFIRVDVGEGGQIYITIDGDTYSHEFVAMAKIIEKYQAKTGGQEMNFPKNARRLLLDVPGEDIVIRREEGDDPDGERSEGIVKCNVPWTAVWHSPDGFEVGYNGSGPADLALNILQQFLPGREVLCFKGTKCSSAAAMLHQQFKAEFIATMDKDGGTIQAQRIKDWIRANLPIEKIGAETAVLPRENNT